MQCLNTKKCKRWKSDCKWVFGNLVSPPPRLIGHHDCKGWWRGSPLWMSGGWTLFILVVKPAAWSATGWSVLRNLTRCQALCSLDLLVWRLAKFWSEFSLTVWLMLGLTWVIEKGASGKAMYGAILSFGWFGRPVLSRIVEQLLWCKFGQNCK